MQKKSPFTSLLFWCVSYSVPSFGLIEISENLDYELMYLPLKGPSLSVVSLCEVGSSNGFLGMEVRLLTKIVTFVTNPIYGYTIQLPEHPATRNGSYGEYYQFGFSPATDEFKVLRIVVNIELYDCWWEGLYYVDECQIFTVGVDSCWRRLPTNSSTKLPHENDFATLDGFFYWIPVGGRPDFISTFDLAEEKFGRISLPPSLLLESGPIGLYLLGNQLALMDSSHSSQVSFWTMNKNSVVDSWTKVVISSSWYPYKDIRWVYPVAELKNGDMLFRECESLVSCNVEQKRTSEIKLKSIGGEYGFTLIPGYSPIFFPHAEHIVQSELENSPEYLESTARVGFTDFSCREFLQILQKLLIGN